MVNTRPSSPSVPLPCTIDSSRLDFQLPAGESRISKKEKKDSTMSDTAESLGHNVKVPIEQHLSENDDEYREPESPGTQRMQHLRTIETVPEDSEVSVKLMERPVSSGSATFATFAYQAPSQRHPNVHRKPTVLLCSAPSGELRIGSNASPAHGGVSVAPQISNQASDRRRSACAFLSGRPDC